MRPTHENLCEMCGEDLRAGTSPCPYCGTIQAHATLPRDPFRTLNLKAGMPSVDEALKRLSSAISEARLSKTRVLKIIHGHGSSGEGGALRPALRAELSRLMRDGLVSDFLPGEDLSSANPRTARYKRVHPRVASDPDLDRANPGITLVILGG